MTITPRIKNQYFQNGKGVIRLAPSQDHSLPTNRAGTPWTLQEHELFLEALELYPSGPWKIIAAHIKTRTTRQTMTHAQKYREKIARRKKAKAGVTNSSTVQVVDKNCRNTQKPSPYDADWREELMDNPFTQFPEQIDDLGLDDTVNVLLETFEPLEPFEVVSTLEPCTFGTCGPVCEAI